MGLYIGKGNRTVKIEESFSGVKEFRKPKEPWKLNKQGKGIP